MRRWTDGKSWSASRVSGSFLTYREMEGKRGGNGLTPPAQSRSRSSRSDAGSDEDGPDGYRYKPDGLMKQSFSITTTNGQHLHLISYYARASPTATELQQPSNDPNLRHIRPSKTLYPESSVNESTNVPAVTRGPMAGSPYATAQIPSPYTRPAAYPPGYPPPTSWPPTPSATPPYVYAYYPHGPPPPGHPHSPGHYAYAPYPPPGAYPPFPHTHATTPYDRAPPPIATSALPPPPPHHATAHHLSISGPQYIPNPSPRTSQAPQVGPQSHPYSHLPPSSYADPRNVPATTSGPAALETTQGPVLPAVKLNPIAPLTNGDKQPSPKSTEIRPAVPETLPPLAEPNGTKSKDATPPRTVPSLGALLNAHPSDPIVDSRSDKSGSRAGSKSPSNSAMPRSVGAEFPRDKLPPISGAGAADQAALRRLDSAFVHVS